MLSYKFLFLAAAASMAACASAGPSTGSGEPVPGLGEPQPALSVVPVQVSPAPGASLLTQQQIEAAAVQALAEPTVAAAVRQGSVEKVQVRADAQGGRTVVFLFRTPIEPTGNLWPVLCDIGGQTKEWKGVAVKIAAAGSGQSIDSSPVWLTGRNCVGAHVEQ
jgi:hypothetical protein